MDDGTADVLAAERISNRLREIPRGADAFRSDARPDAHLSDRHGVVFGARDPVECAVVRISGTGAARSGAGGAWNIYLVSDREPDHCWRRNLRVVHSAVGA